MDAVSRAQKREERDYLNPTGETPRRLINVYFGSYRKNTGLVNRRDAYGRVRTPINESLWVDVQYG